MGHHGRKNGGAAGTEPIFQERSEPWIAPLGMGGRQHFPRMEVAENSD